jgi:hypothetical protein
LALFTKYTKILLKNQKMKNPFEGMGKNSIENIGKSQ